MSYDPNRDLMPALTQTMLDRAHEVDDSIEEQARLESAEEAAVRSRIGERYCYHSRRQQLSKKMCA